MAEIVRMPKLSDTMTEGVVAEWHKKVGDEVEAGDLLAEIETDKATMEFESFQDGVLLHIGVEKGGSAPVDSILAILGEKGEDIEALLKEEGSSEEKPTEPKKEEPKAEKEAPKEAPKKEAAPAPAASQSQSSDTADGGRIKASPLAKKLADDKGIDIQQVKGSGEGGRIVKRDIENFKPSAASSAASFATSGPEYTEEAVSQMRKTIARRLAESKFSAPHFYLNIDIDMDAAIEARKAINESIEGKVSFNDMVIKAVSIALTKNPAVNSSWLEDKIRYNNVVNIGVAVAVPDGLLVPVIRNANFKSLTQINGEVKEYAQKAKDKKLQPSDWEGNTFTISNLGMFGIEDFTAIINPPDSCILAVGAIRQEPVVKNGAVVPGNRMKVTLSCDHRVVDGATGAQFLQDLKTLLENPVRMLA
ncbi:pyruvate dehydrogenase complex dihydrolipoamide acetyltransferase [Luteibaculum oceani]|uniref:Acetyltransferase component of pyruvate dehydrogenase complex n=1 Tax=Luteibaculum oceani TaxID=1294296 RepID=A0A5C6V130_9FLAO|nr:pyruvate dehydrogenase complex dihydrolipoamide acetyltransferase [Luteibaculum oceani]TXC78331.1 pyruvate dehydrogenase complex dihydrolipoamide acetyltransferase [Luteibaculum oceani]